MRALPAELRRDDVAVGMPAWQNILPRGERIEVITIQQISHRAVIQRAISGQLVREEERFGQNVGFVIGRILLADPIVSALGYVRESPMKHAGNKIARLRDAA